MTRHADVIIVGAGVLGTFHAYFAGRKGLRVLLVERDGSPSGVSIRNFGMLPQSIVGPDEPWTEYARESADIYRAIQLQHDISVTQPGSLYLASTELEATVLLEFAQRFGEAYPCTFLHASDVASYYPLVHESYCTAGLVFPQDLALDPREMLSRLIPVVVQSERVEYLPSTAIVSVRTRGQECVVCSAAGETLTAERVIICSGAEYRTLFPDLLYSQGLRVCKLQMMRTVSLGDFRLPHSILSGLSIRRYPAFTSCPSYTLLLSEPIDEQIRSFDIHVLLKGEADGTVCIGDSHEYLTVQDASLVEERSRPAINEAILRYAQSMLWLPSWEIQDTWNGYYLVNPNGPIFAHAVDERIHVVTGIGGRGMTTGPAYARRSIDALFA